MPTFISPYANDLSLQYRAALIETGLHEVAMMRQLSTPLSTTDSLQTSAPPHILRKYTI